MALAIQLGVRGELRDPAGVFPPAIRSAVTETVALLEREVKRRVPIGVTEAARGSIAGEVRVGTALGMGDALGTVGSPIAYVRVLNDGRRPGQRMPPPESLELWVRRKITKTGPRGGNIGLTVKEARSIAFLIARAIGRRGTPPLHFFEDALTENEARIRAIWHRAGVQIAFRMNGGN